MKLKKTNKTGDWFTTNGDWKEIGFRKFAATRFNECSINTHLITRIQDDKRFYHHPDGRKNK